MVRNIAIEIVTDIDSDFVEASGIDDRWRQDIEAPKNYKDPEKIASYVEERIAQKLEGAKNSPLTGKLCAVYLQPIGEDGPPICIDDPDEGIVVHALARHFLESESMVRLVGWGLRRRWLPFLAVRTALHRVIWPGGVSLNPKDWRSVIDLQDDLGLDGEFDWWALRFGIKPPDGNPEEKVQAIATMAQELRRALPWKFVESREEALV